MASAQNSRNTKKDEKDKLIQEKDKLKQDLEKSHKANKILLLKVIEIINQ